MANSALKKVLPFTFMGLAILVVVPYFFFTEGRLWRVRADPSHAFPESRGVLLHLEFEKQLEDLSGSGFRPTLRGGSFEDSPLGTGLAFGKGTLGGLDCSRLAPRLVHPFTIEMVLIPMTTSSYRKLIDLDPQTDEGWYYSQQGLANYPVETFGTGKMLPGQLHSLAWVSTRDGGVKVYFQGKLIGKAKSWNRGRPRNLAFFQDDAQTSSEHFLGLVEALRISSLNRSARELSDIYERLARVAPKASKEPPPTPGEIRSSSSRRSVR